MGPGRRSVLGLLCGLAWIAGGGAAPAQGGPDAGISRLISAGQVAAARALLETGNPTPAERLFFDARVRKAQGDFAGAIGVFRDVLRADPNHLNARRELAHTLLLNREFGAAEHHFGALLQIDGNPEMQAGYRQFLAIIDQNKPAGFSGHFSVLPSTNVNRGTANTVFDTTLGTFVIDPNARAASGVGLQAGLAGYFRHQIGPASRVAVNWSVATTRYQRRSHDSTTGQLALTYERLTERGRWAFGPYYRQIWRKDPASMHAVGLSLAFAHRLSDRNRLDFDIAHERQFYPRQGFRDGTLSSATLRLTHQIDPSLALHVGAGIDVAVPDAAHLQYLAYRGFAGLSKTWQGGLGSRIGVEFGRRDFVGVFPLTTRSRGDEVLQIRVGVQHSRIDFLGFTPDLSCSHTINRSNVAFYDFTATDCRLAVTRSF